MSNNSNYKIDQENKIVKVYNKSTTDKEFNSKIMRFKQMGYDVILLDRQKPKKRGKGISKDDLRIYLKEKIDKNVYNKLLEHLNGKENYLVTQSWLKKELIKTARDQNKKYIPFRTIIETEKAKEQATTKDNIADYQEQHKKENGGNGNQEQKNK